MYADDVPVDLAKLKSEGRKDATKTKDVAATIKSHIKEIVRNPMPKSSAAEPTENLSKKAGFAAASRKATTASTTKTSAPEAPKPKPEVK